MGEDRFAAVAAGRSDALIMQIDRRLAMEHEVTETLAASSTLAEAAATILAIVCGELGWTAGSCWRFSESLGTLAHVADWSAAAPSIEEFLAHTRTMSISPSPGGLIRRAWLAGEPLWVRDVSKDESFNRAPLAAQAGLHSAFAFPIKTGSQVSGIMEFFSTQVHEPDVQLLECMSYVGRQIGLFMQRAELENKLRESEAHYRAVIDSANEGILVYDRSLRVTAGNSAAERIIGLSLEQLMGAAAGFTSLLPCIHENGTPLKPEQRPTRLTMQTGRPLSNQVFGIKRPDGRVTWLSVNTGFLRRQGEQDYYGVVSTIADITAQRSAQLALRKSEERFRSLTHLSSDVYWEQDAQLRFTSFSAAASEAENPGNSGYLGTRAWDHPYANMTSEDWSRHIAELEAHRPFRDLELCRVDYSGKKTWLSISGEPVFDPSGAFAGYRGVGKDISERKRAEERISYLAHHDALTGLPNRALFTELLNHALENGRRHSRSFAVLFVDLDRFKVINDTLGHEAGDNLLRQIAQRLSEVLRSSDVVARLGGDEFVVLLQELAAGQVEQVAQKILAALMTPVPFNGTESRITASVGIALYPADGADEQTLMKHADIAMYQAKQEGKNTFSFFGLRRPSPDIS
jgi:diguanylate cyclase (GGDEF)-like protein/PAS domain S-box-containing protein